MQPLSCSSSIKLALLDHILTKSLSNRMVYTKARLEDALRVFRHNPNCRERRGLPSESLERRLRSNYGFRKPSKLTPLANVNVWQAKFGDSSSDDDEYDPKEERKRLAVRNNKKKRKLDDAVDRDGAGERETKKMKGEGSSSNLKNDNTFLTLRLTSDKGTKLLRSIDALGLVPRIVQGSSKAGSSREAPRSSGKYFDKYLPTGAVRDRKLADLVDEGLLEMHVDVDDEFVSNKHKVLRNGKVVEKAAKKQKKPSKPKNIPTSPSSDEEHDPVLIVTKPANYKPAPPTNRIRLNGPAVTKGSASSIRDPFAGSSAKNPISIDSDPEDTLPAPRRRIQGNHLSLRTTEIAKDAGIKQEAALPISPISLPSTRSDSPPPSSSPAVLTISTAFAHPLVFLPSTTPPATVTQQCHFCTDPRMSIIGLGRCHVQVFTDPDNPLVYQEMEGGFRGQGFESTVICLSCVEARIRMMKCHLKKSAGSDKRNKLTEDDDDMNRGFERLRVRRLIGEVNANVVYQKWLFQQRSKDKTKSPLEPCSLCPMPAGWVCCRLHGGRAGDITGSTKDRHISTSHGLTSATGLPQFLGSTGRDGGRSVSKASKDEDVIMIDSEDEDEPFTTGSREMQLQRQNREYSEASARELSSARSSSFVSHVSNGSQQLSRGCGLKLCQGCKTLVVDRCRGALDKKVLMAQFNAASANGLLSGRADVEFLFRGSSADRFYEQELRRRAANAEDQG